VNGLVPTLPILMVEVWTAAALVMTQVHERVVRVPDVLEASLLGQYRPFQALLDAAEVIDESDAEFHGVVSSREKNQRLV
jgi:hypothetical protein